MPTISRTGWVFFVKHLRMEQRPKKPFARTVGSYQVYRDGNAVAALVGTTVERQGPGDTGSAGHAHHNRIESGSYALMMHGTGKYATTGYRIDTKHPRPAIGVEPRGQRSAVLIHPAGEYGSTIGCINLSGPLAGPSNIINLAESVRRVIAVIEDLRAYSGAKFPSHLKTKIPAAWLIIEDQGDA